jgi:hypothetical protein
MNEIAVIIPMYNFGDLTRNCIDATFENSGVPVDIHVVDDGSKEPFKDDRVTVHRLNKNVGFTGATNYGILQCWNKYKYIHFLNNDTVPKENFIKILLDILKSDPEIGIASSARETKLNGKMMLELYPMDLLTGWTGYQDIDESLDDVYLCPWLPICSALVPTHVLHQTGLLDRRMKNHCSDNDFCVRAGEMGYRTVLVTKSRIYHIHEVTTSSAGINSAEDQGVLICKIRCDYKRDLLKHFPINKKNDKRGLLEFKII